MLPLATRCGINPSFACKHIACKTHIAFRRKISQIVLRIYIAKQKICFPKKADFVVFTCTSIYHPKCDFDYQLAYLKNASKKSQITFSPARVKAWIIRGICGSSHSLYACTNKSSRISKRPINICRNLGKRLILLGL